MATLQKLRDRGPLLIIFVGLALFAFIAGDAWKMLSPHQNSQEVGEVNGESLSATDFSQMLEEYNNIVKNSRGGAALSEQEEIQNQDRVWYSYVNSRLIEDEAAKIGLTVTDAEVEAVVNAGQHPLLRMTPFHNPQTGTFDKELLQNFLYQYSQNKDNQQFVSQYKSFYDTWSFVEKELKKSLLAEKYQSLLLNSFAASSPAAEELYNAQKSESEIVVATYPYSLLPDSTVKVSDADYQKAYDKRKEAYKLPAETRDLKYVALQIQPSNADRNAHMQKINEQAQILAQDEIANLANFINYNSEVKYSQVPVSKIALPTDVAARIDTVAVGKVHPAYYNSADDSYNTFKLLSKETRPDSVQYSQLIVRAANEKATEQLQDSIMQALKGGADFAEIAKIYGQESQPVWISTRDIEGGRIVNDDAQYVNTLFTTPKGETKAIKLNVSGNRLIVKIDDTRSNSDKYLALVIKTPAKFSNETRNKVEGEFRQFMASCTNVDDMVKKAAENGYRLQESKGTSSDAHLVANIAKSHEALRWAFDAKAGEVSPMYHCGNNDWLLFVGVSDIHKQGYRDLNSIKHQLASDVIKEKKAAEILPKMNSDFNVLANMSEVRIDTIKFVSFSSPATVRGYMEPAISAKASQMQANETSEPFKGNGGVYVVKVLSKKDKPGNFDADVETTVLKSRAAQNASRFANDLYLKANVKDNRYLYFQ